MTDHAHPLARAGDRWEAVLEDMAVTAEEYRDAGWTVLELQPGDVNPVVDDPDADPRRVGFDVLVGDNELADLTDLVEVDDAAFDDFQVFKGQTGQVVFLLVTIEDRAREAVVCLPLYYDAQDAAEMLAEAERQGRLDAYVRPLDRRETVTFSHDDPGLFC